MSDTPRTDLQQFVGIPDAGRGPRFVVEADFARELEREAAMNTGKYWIEVLDALRGLLRIEYMRRNYFELPWKCAEADCPHFGKPLSRDGCTCVSDFERKHVAAVKKELGL